MKKTSKSRMARNQRLLSTIAIIVSIIAIATSSYAILNPQTKTVIVYRNVTVNNTKSIMGYNINSTLLQPPASLSDAPIITKNQSFGKRLTNINAPFNASELAIINNEPNAYFQTGGAMLLNHSLNNSVGVNPAKLPLFILNGKPTVIYLGSITCVFCGENRWAMALALSRFGNFTQIFKGYSAIGDADLPTVYWAPAHYNTSSTVLGSFYSSKYINFLAIEDANPISGGFNLNPISTIQKRINQTNNTAYIDAIKYIISTNAFSGTPYTVWGAYQVAGADAVVFGNSTPSSGVLPLQSMTHQVVLAQLANPKDQFAWSEYAAADFYVAMICKTMNNTAQVCSLPAIQGIEAQAGF